MPKKKTIRTTKTRCDLKPPKSLAEKKIISGMHCWKDIYGTTYTQNVNDFNKLSGEGKLSVKNERMVEVIALFNDHNHPWVSVQCTIKDLEKLVKQAKKRKKEFKDRFFVHLNPELSFYIKK